MTSGVSVCQRQVVQIGLIGRSRDGEKNHFGGISKENNQFQQCIHRALNELTKVEEMTVEWPARAA